MAFKRRDFLSIMSLLPASNVLAKAVSHNDNYGGKYIDGAIQYNMSAVYAKREIVSGKKSDVIEYRVDGQSSSMPFPILRAKINQKIRVIFHNKMNKTTTVHWHGIRIKNDMDGVPFLTQQPIKPNETFVYEFTCPDAGTFWFHSHQNSLEQMGRGQMGILLVDYEDENKPFLKQFYSDNIWMLKDYYIDNNGKNINCTSMANSATDGTLGNQKRINGKEIGAIKAPSGSWVRIRLINGDNTRMAKINAYDENNNKVNARVLLVDGNPLRKHRKLNKDYLTPGQRLDIAIKVPSSGLVSIKDVGGEKHHTIGVIKSNGSTKQHTELLSFPVNNIPKPNLSETITKRFAFLSSADSMGKFWSINGKSMGEHSTKQDFKADDMGMGCDNNHDKVMDIIHQQMADKEMAKPLAVLEKGKSYKFRIQNGTKHSHPIHLHGHTFVVLKSSLNKNLQPYHTDIVPLEPQEIIDFAFVADNVGDWMFHCHIIEHSVTGMMGYITVK